MSKKDVSFFRGWMAFAIPLLVVLEIQYWIDRWETVYYWHLVIVFVAFSIFILGGVVIFWRLLNAKTEHADG